MRRAMQLGNFDFDLCGDNFKSTLKIGFGLISRRGASIKISTTILVFEVSVLNRDFTQSTFS